MSIFNKILWDMQRKKEAFTLYSRVKAVHKKCPNYSKVEIN